MNLLVYALYGPWGCRRSRDHHDIAWCLEAIGEAVRELEGKAVIGAGSVLIQRRRELAFWQRGFHSQPSLQRRFGGDM